VAMLAIVAGIRFLFSRPATLNGSYTHIPRFPKQQLPFVDRPPPAIREFVPPKAPSKVRWNSILFGPVSDATSRGGRGRRGRYRSATLQDAPGEASSRRWRAI